MLSLQDKDAKKNKKVFIELINFYNTPSFGAVKQREFDIFLFSKLQEIGVFENKDDVYEVISKLKVTRSKARNLIYESSLRNDNQNLDEQLKNELKKIRFLKDSSYLIGIEIDNPLVIDYIKAKLKIRGYATDGSFSPEIVKLSSDAFVFLLDFYLSESDKKKLLGELIKLGYKENNNFKDLLNEWIKDAAKIMLGSAGECLANKLIAPLIDGMIDRAIKIYSDMKS